MIDVSKELRIILGQLPSMRLALRDYYRGLKGSAKDE